MPTFITSTALNPTVGDGQHGTARWATKSEIQKIYNHIPFTPEKWREQAAKGETPTVSRIVKRRFFKKKNEEPEEALPQGIVVGCTGGKHHTTAMVDTGDVHALMIGAAGVGKTAFWMYPCIEYACASGMSFLSTDTKGDVMRNYGNIAKGYGYNVSVIDLRNPTRSNGNNLLHLVNKYMDLYQQENKLIYKQLYREILAVADENKGKLKNRCVFFCDEFGTLPKIESAEMMFSASRSRRLQIVPIIQSFSQFDKNYGKEGAEIIVDNTQLTIFGGFAPNSSSAEVLSKALGSRTVMSGSVSRSKNDPSQSLQMIERPLLTPDELKSMPKGQFVVMKTGVHPMRVRLKLFKNWGISFNEKNPYTVADKGDRKVVYAEKQEIIEGIMKKYRKKEYEEMKEAEAAAAAGIQDQAESQSNEPQQTPPQNSNDKKKGGNDLKTEPPSRRHSPPSRENRELKPSEQA